jgi:two-component system, NtrC family, nitrogen regulation response regulator GlnG
MESPLMSQEDADTLRADESDEGREAQRSTSLACLTIVYHRDASRVGERALIVRQANQKAIRLARSELDFAPPAGDRAPEPLSDPYVSRAAIELGARADGSITLEIPERAQVKIDGAAREGHVRIERERIERGAILELGKRRVALLLHAADVGPRASDCGMIGESAGIRAVRRSVLKVADLDVPVLLRGETGVGKGASERRAGLFERADGGTLFLDEIGELSIDVQPMLLRALESSAVRPLGEGAEKPLRVRVIAATDVDLERNVREGSFRAALFHRLRGFEITVPPLRERREDVARLLVSFLREELAKIGELHRLELRDADEPPWIDPRLAIRLAMHDWPGNVRQLRGVVRQIVVSSRGEATLRADDAVLRALEAERPQGERNAGEIGRAEILAALAEHAWSFGAAARALGITRSALYRRAEADPEIRTANDLDRAELERGLLEHGGEVAKLAAALHVSERALKLRLRALGLI